MGCKGQNGCSVTSDKWCVCVFGGGSGEKEVCVCVCVPVREFAGHVSPSLLWRLLNGSCAPGAGFA